MLVGWQIPFSYLRKKSKTLTFAMIEDYDCDATIKRAIQDPKLAQRSGINGYLSLSLLIDPDKLLDKDYREQIDETALAKHGYITSVVKMGMDGFKSALDELNIDYK